MIRLPPGPTLFPYTTLFRSAGGAHGYLLRSERHRPPPHPEPGDPQPAVVLRGLPARPVHVGPGEDGRVREPRLAEGPRLPRGVRHRGLQRLAPGPDLPGCGRLMYSRILVPLENSPADETILAHARGLAKRLGSTLVLIHVADGWLRRDVNELELRESQEIREDRAYL